MGVVTAEQWQPRWSTAICLCQYGAFPCGPPYCSDLVSRMLAAGRWIVYFLRQDIRLHCDEERCFAAKKLTQKRSHVLRDFSSFILRIVAYTFAWSRFNENRFSDFVGFCVLCVYTVKPSAASRKQEACSKLLRLALPILQSLSREKVRKLWYP